MVGRIFSLSLKLVNASKIVGQCLKDYRDEHAEIVHNNSHILADVKIMRRFRFNRDANLIYLPLKKLLQTNFVTYLALNLKANGAADIRLADGEHMIYRRRRL